MNSLELRGALGRFATGVCLITVADEKRGPLALTANSFASVSLEPPLALWSLHNSSDCFEPYTTCEYYGISVLTSEQEALSNRYASPDQHAVDPEDFVFDERGVPMLTAACARFHMRNWQQYPGGDHTIIVGEILAFSAGDAAPLLFSGGRYDALASSGQP